MMHNLMFIIKHKILNVLQNLFNYLSQFPSCNQHQNKEKFYLWNLNGANTINASKYDMRLIMSCNRYKV